MVKLGIHFWQNFKITVLEFSDYFQFIYQYQKLSFEYKVVQL